MRTAALRPLLVLGVAGAAALGATAPASAHGGLTIAKGGTGGVSILTQGEQADDGSPAIDVSTTIEGPGTGKGASVVYYVRPAGRETAFRVTTTRDDAGIASADIATAGRGNWRRWDLSAVVTLSTGKKLRVSNAEANPPGPEPAATPGGGALGAEGSETGTSTAQAPSASEDQDPTASEAPASADQDVQDVSGDDGGTPGWVVPSAVVVVLLAIAVVVLQRRRRGPGSPGDVG